MLYIPYSSFCSFCYLVALLDLTIAFMAFLYFLLSCLTLLYPSTRQGLLFQPRSRLRPRLGISTPQSTRDLASAIDSDCRLRPQLGISPPSPSLDRPLLAGSHLLVFWTWATHLPNKRNSSPVFSTQPIPISTHRPAHHSTLPSLRILSHLHVLVTLACLLVAHLLIRTLPLIARSSP